MDAHQLDEVRDPKSVCRPYHTLLFPNSSPLEVLKGLTEHEHCNEMTTSPSISHSLRRILPHVQPRKSLHETGWDAGLALPHVMDAANLLIHYGICLAVMPVLRKNRYTCVDGVVLRMSSVALPFWQTFGVRSRNCKFHWGDEAGGGSTGVDDGTTQKNRSVTTGAPHIFGVVSALTTHAQNSSASPTLGEAVDLLSGNEPTLDESIGDQTPGEIVYSMAVWLIANKIIVEVKDCLVADGASPDSDSGDKPEPCHQLAATSSGESLYHELSESGCLDGTTSIAAICYRFGLDRNRIETLLSSRTHRLKVVRHIEGNNGA